MIFSNRYRSRLTSAGFTLVEMMLALIVSSLILATIYMSYLAQQRTYLAQEQVAEMQQNIRAGMDRITREIRLAGYEAIISNTATISEMDTGRIEFSYDDNDDGTIGADEIIAFGFAANTATGNDDADRNGVPDILVDGNPDPLSLGRQSGGSASGNPFQPLADNIQRIEFRYLDQDGVVSTTLADIRSVQISMLARAAQPDRKFNNSKIYRPGSGTPWGPYNDNFRRRLLITTINCRNMGL